MKRRTPAADLLRKLQSDKAFVQDRSREEEERQKRAAEWQKAEAPLVKELVAAGYAIESVWDLVNTAAPYPGALPILLKHLVRSYPVPVREGIARALAVPEAKVGWKTLVHLYEVEQDPRAKDALAAALAAAADLDVIDDLVHLARNKRHGASRLLLLSAFRRIPRSRARAALMELGADPELAKEIQAIFKRGQAKH